MFAKKSLGQHFIRCNWVVDTLVQSAVVSKTDRIVEVGPGTGILTRVLAQTAHEVIAVEKDEKLAEELTIALASEKISNVRVVTGDILKIFPEVVATHTLQPITYKLVANIPYYLTSRLIRILLEEGPQPHTIAFTIQKEVAERIVAKPPHMSLLSLSVQIFGTPHLVKIVPRTCFWPQPKIDSALCTIKVTNSLDAKNDLKELFTLARQGFAQKRKKLSHTLGKTYGKTVVETALATVGISKDARPQELAPSQWQNLLNLLKKEN